MIISGVIIWALILFFQFIPTPFTGGDNAHYWSLAESITIGSYNRLYSPGTPPETSTLPGLPLLLAPFFAIDEYAFLPAKIVISFFCFLVGLFFSYKLYRLCGWPSLLAFLTVTLLAVNIRISEFSHWILTESPSFLLITASVFCFEKFIKSKSKRYLLIVTGLISSYAVYVRIASVPIILAIIIYLLLKKEWRLLGLYLTTIAISFLPWLLWLLVKSGEAGNFYLSHLLSNEAGGSGETMGGADLLFRLWGNFRTYNFGHIPNLLFSSLNGSFSQPRPLVTIIGILLLPLWAGSLASKLRTKNLGISALLFVFYIGMLYFWAHPKWSTVRYLVGAAPIIVFLVIDGVSAYQKFFKKQVLDYIQYSIIIVAIISSLIQYIPEAKKATRIRHLYSNGVKLAGYHPVEVNFVKSCQWIRNNTPKESILVSRKPRLSYMWSKRTGYTYNFTQNTAVIMAEIDSIGANYVIIDRISGTTQAYLIPTIQAYPHRFETVYQTSEPKTFVLKVLPPVQPPRLIDDAIIERNSQ